MKWKKKSIHEMKKKSIHEMNSTISSSWDKFRDLNFMI